MFCEQEFTSSWHSGNSAMVSWKNSKKLAQMQAERRANMAMDEI